MLISRTQLANLVKTYRQNLQISQEELVKKCGVATNRSAVAHLEQGLRLPKPKVLSAICKSLGIPAPYWEPFTDPESLQLLEFEELISELVGHPVTLSQLDEDYRAAAEKQIRTLLSQRLSSQQTYDLFNSILVYYGVQAASPSFFERYLADKAFVTLKVLSGKILRYQEDAIRLFSTLTEAYRTFNTAVDVSTVLVSLRSQSLDSYMERTHWDVIEQIEEVRLPDLGYISAERVKKETAERQAVKTFLEKLADNATRKGNLELEKISEKTKRRMDSMLRKFNTALPYGLFSPLFAPDPDLLVREAARLAPKTDLELARMNETQQIAERNFAHYVSADYMDVYVATSMRTDADFVSVNEFVRSLFSDDVIRNLKLRYFNPTQSWIDDRIAKGLVEALMLRRATIAVYMAQKGDTFGKDSEASVALGLGRPVVVYVPKLVVNGVDIDTERLFQLSRADLLSLVSKENQEFAEDIDDSIDEEALVSAVLTARLKAAAEEQLVDTVRSQWADFDLYSEADRIPDQQRAEYRTWLDAVVKEKLTRNLPEALRPHLLKVLVATAIRFERRAQVFREIHPLALQIILSSGVLNGILVVRSVRQCAEVLRDLLANDLRLKLEKDELNYRLIEKRTKSTIRVISRNKLLRNAFEAQYERERRQQYPSSLAVAE